MLDCLLINPSALSQIYQNLEDLAAIEPPIWAGLLANGLRAKGKRVAIWDMEAEPDAEGTEHTNLIAIIVYGQQPSASTQNMHAASELLRALKKMNPDGKIILIGGHVSALPLKTMQEELCDFVAEGEGLYTLLGLINNQPKENIPGLWYRDGNDILSSKVKSKPIPKDDLKVELPGVAWDLLPMSKYRAHNWHVFSDIENRGNYASIYTSLGCSFACTFCCINAPFGGSSFRFWDTDFTLSQLDILAQNYNVRNLKIADEMFVLNKNHYMKIIDGLCDRKAPFNIWAYSRIDTVKPETLNAMKQAGINWLALGIESGSRFVRDGVQKGRFNDIDIKLIVQKIKDAGINVIGNYIFGLPDDDYKSMNETLNLAIDLNCEMSNFYSAMAYPGSKLYTMALQNNWELPKTWLGYSQHSKECLPLKTNHLTSAQVLAFRDQAFKLYFQGPEYLNLIDEKFGPKTLLHIKQMLRHDLKRDRVSKTEQT